MVHRVSRKQLLLTRENSNILYNSGRYYISNRLGEEEKLLGSVPFGFIHALVSRIPLASRIFRTRPRCAAWVDDSSFITAQRGAVWYIDIKTGEVHKEHCFETGMSAPLDFCTLKNLAGFSDGVLYGTYRSIPNADVSIWNRDERGKWHIVFNFPSGRVLHIHKLIPDYAEDRLLVLTGDSDYESGIWEFRGGFKEPRMLLGGNQQYRACAAFPEDRHILYATDTPLEKNNLYDYDERSGHVEVLCQLPGPVIYNGSFIDRGEQIFCFSTSVEPDSHIHGLSYLLSRKRGAGVLSWQSHVFIGNRRLGFREICAFQKDMWPMGLCEFGNVFFPNGECQHLYAAPRSVKRYDGTTVEIEP